MNGLAMQLMIRSLILAFITATGLQADPVLIEPKDASCARIGVDSTRETDTKEEEFQEGLNEFFSPESLAIDTTGWNVEHINAVHFDYQLMTDTLRITLADPRTGRLFFPPAQGSITSPFGIRRSIWHYGTDIKVKKGDTIRCAFDGIVRVIQNDRHGYGKVVVVRHHDGLETLYGHLSKSAVAGNQRIGAGDMIGLGGNTGHSTGSHLHFEIRFRGEPFDPNDVIDFENFTLRADTLVLTRDNFAYLAEASKTVCHVVQRGETLGGIAHRYGTTVGKICAANGITTRSVLKIGRKLVVRKGSDADPEMSFGRSMQSRKEDKPVGYYKPQTELPVGHLLGSVYFRTYVEFPD
jgi:hypothetical protein